MCQSCFSHIVSYSSYFSCWFSIIILLLKHLTTDCVYMFIPHHFICFLIVFIFLYIALHIDLINSRLEYKGTPKYLGEGVTGSEIGLQN